MNTLINKYKQKNVNPHIIDYKEHYSFKYRLDEATRMLAKYPENILIILQRAKGCNQNCPIIQKNKYMIKNDTSFIQFMMIVRNNLKLPDNIGLFFYCGNIIPSPSNLIVQLYKEYKDADGYLYIYYNTENVFG